MAQTITVDAVAEQHGRPGILTGKRFFVLQRVPNRLAWVERIRGAGGSVVRMESQADYTIADDRRIDCPINSVSYKFLQDSLDKNTLVDPDSYRCDSAAGAARPVSSLLVPPKSTRRKYTAEDDELLMAHLSTIARRGEPIMGNRPYIDLAAKVGRHPWQSWRSRYVDTLSKLQTINALIGIDTPDRTPAANRGVDASTVTQAPAQPDTTIGTNPATDDAVSGSASPEQRSLELNDRQRELSTLLRKRNVRTSANERFSSHDIESIILNLKDIPNITISNWKAAWEEWAQGARRHTSQDWINFYVNHVVDVLTLRGWNHSLEDIGPSQTRPVPNASNAIQSSPLASRTATMTDPATDKQLKRKPSTSIKQPSSKRRTSPTAQGSPVISQPEASSHHGEGDDRVESQHTNGTNRLPNGTPDPQRTQPHQTNTASQPPSDTGAETTPLVSAAQREKLEWAFDQALQKKNIEDNSTLHAASPTTPSQHRLTAANLAAQSRQQSRTPSQANPQSAIRETNNSQFYTAQSQAVRARSSPGDERLAKSSDEQPFTIPPHIDYDDVNLFEHSDASGDSAAIVSQRGVEQARVTPEPQSANIASNPVLEIQQSDGAHETANESSKSFDSALLGTASNPRADMDGLNVPTFTTFDVDLSMPSPYKPTEAERRARLSGSQIASANTASHAESPDIDEAGDQSIDAGRQPFTMDTQALLNAKTQVPDFSIPGPYSVPHDLSASIEQQEDGSVEGQDNSQWHDGMRLDNPDGRTPSSPVDDAESIDGDDIEDFFREFGSRGYTDDEITTALRMTCARPDLAEFVLLLRRRGEPFPEDVPGIWTAEDDETLQSGNARKLRALEEKHGTEEYNIRMDFIAELAADTQD